ncbi:MAG: DapH/DapD/GlmU-related protein [Actinomycetota bacterium]|nr:DapH/DapD/GlmU-related protein [Actinomycetota bacterium]
MSGPTIHETASVEPGAEVGAGTAIWHQVHVRAGAHIGRDCSLGKNVFVDAGVHIGDRVKIQNNVSVYAGVTLDDDVFVGPSAVFTNDRFPRAHGRAWKVTPTNVRRGASIGGGAVIVCGVTLAEWSMVGAGSVVTHDTQPHEHVLGTPARHFGWSCWCGVLVSRDVNRPVDTTCTACGLKLGDVGAP